MSEEDVQGLLNELVDLLQQSAPTGYDEITRWRLECKRAYQRVRQAVSDLCAERDAAVAQLARVGLEAT